MKVSLKWLSEYTAVPEDLKAFCDRLDLTGTGVEGVEKTGEAFEGVVVGHVLTCEPHPDSDHMHVVTVDVGAEELVQIVCGAPNIAADVKVPVALRDTGFCLRCCFAAARRCSRFMGWEGFAA